MHARSSLSESQREAAVAWFEKGTADKATASLLGVSRGPVNRLYRRWRIHGRGALVAKSTKRMYSYEFKIALVERFIAGETSPDLAAEAGLSSPRLLETWVRAYRREGADALQPKSKGRPRKPDAPPPAELPELERLRRENERLRAEVAYLGKLRALRAQERR
ncbi:helix-turn-helix domain-containing protein [Arthrobacter sp. FX8]|uniref:helix-turn-helix domain-containing protein n=1 Tax=Arthrobacter sp. FX8 TaxID=2997335 RepID=UPI00227B409C|nr:helix-turn-helix domain-containing protein [Arthrobacter sp. FX8]WAJ32942.1 helix-turn-helix domain-containing protein [Arthrobacter sp. FX8]